MNRHRIRLTRAQVQDLFQGSNRPKYLNFSPSEETIQSVAIKARSSAVEKGLNSSNLSDIAASHGSPPFSTIFGTWELLKKRGLIPKIQGIGIEVGSGLALLSCAVKKLDVENLINGLIALEATKPFVTSGIGMTSQEILGQNSNSILPCFGVFEEIPVEDNSIDFGIQIESLHHANSLSDAIKEISRIICPGGYFVSIDRSWVDSVSQATLESMLDHQYSSEWLKGKNFDPNVKFTRRDNGEHEYRDCEWIDAFEKYGFRVVSLSFLHPKIEFWHVVKRIISIFHLNRLFSIQVKSRPGVMRTNLAQTVGLK
jgi:SAM-dependent methyltransferase